MTAIHYPLSPEIVNRCNSEMEINSHKGNSWERLEGKDLAVKLQEEYSEFCIAFQKDPSMIEKEGADLINVTAMIISRFGKASD